ncbi:helix-turn-helix domain-containing protein [Xanthomonas hortorum]
MLSLLNQGLTQTDIAKRIGISQSRVAQIKKFSSA